MGSVLWYLLTLPLFCAWLESVYWVVRGVQTFRRGQTRDGRPGLSTPLALADIGIGLWGVVLWTAVLLVAYAGAHR
jgi:hypothetical protein